MRRALPPALTNCLLLAFAGVQAILYSSLMPLWEGFDEPWHYGYVQTLASGHLLPVLGQTRLSAEVQQSVRLVPVSHVVQRNWPELQTFDQYFRLTPEARADQRRKLEQIPRDTTENAGANYEIQQAPLAYAILAPIGFVLQKASMPVRILWLRIVNALLCAVATFAGARYLFKSLALTDRQCQLGSFCIFACQMYWATTAHIASDGIALSLSIWFFAAIADGTRPTRLAIVTALGLLTKAYFLPLAAYAFFFIGWKRIALVLAIAGPWYARNLFLYHNLTGLLMAGIPWYVALTGLTKVPWAHTIPYMLRATLWTGNNSFTTFNSFTLNLLLTLFAIGCGAGLLPCTRAFARLLGAMAIFSAAVIYVVGNDVILQHGTSAGAEPWYTLPLLPPIVAIAIRGASRFRPLAIGFVLLSAYICIATYLVKLIPLYGGYPEGRSTLRGILTWYATSGRELTGMLSTISLAPPILICLETAAVAGLALTLAVRLC